MKASLTPADAQDYTFESFHLDAGKRLLFDGDGEALPLTPKAFDILLYLLRHKDQIVGKEELMSAFWPDTAVEENNLTQNISAIRRVLGEKHRENRFIATVPGRGYKFVAEVTARGEGTGNDRNGLSEHDAESDASAETPPNTEQDRTSGKPRMWVIPAVAAALVLIAAAIVIWRSNSPAAPDPEIRSLAILPFKSLVAGTGDESLELGMADALISKLSGARDISVRPLTAVRRFGAYDQDSIAAGRALGVEAVMDGRIQISGDRIRVTATLFRVSDEKQLWAGQFDEKLTDIFTVQDSISGKVATALKIPLTSLRHEPHTDNVEAYQLYMKGVFHAQRLILPEVQKGIMFFEQAIELDPGYAKAYVGLEQAYRAMVLTNDSPPNEIMPKAKAATRKAIELDPTLAEAWTALAISDFWYDWDRRTAEIHHEKALELDPKSALSHFYYAHMLSNTGRHDEALAEIKRAREIAPVLPVINALEGQILTFAGRYDEALTVLQETVDANPDFWLAHLFLARVYMTKGMYAEALASATKARDLTSGNSEATATVGRALVKMGKRNEAERLMAELDERANTSFVPSYTLAQINLALGNKTKALDLLERGFDEHDALMVFLKVDNEWDELRSEPRFLTLMERMDL